MSLLLLGYLVRNGSERVVTSAREHIYDLRSLENYTHIDENGRDQGINVRQRTRDLIEFIQDDEKLREERKKAKKAKDKFVGMSCDSLGYSGKYSGSSKFDSWPKNDFVDAVSSKMPKFDLGRSRSFEDSPEQSNDEDRRSENDDRVEYKDEDANVTEVKNIKIHSNNLENKSSAKSNRKIDLGAAANYGKDQNSVNSTPEKSISLIDTTTPKHTPNNKSKDEADLLASLSISSPTNANESANGDFADFTQFKSAEDSSQDNFADFSSFTSPSQPKLSSDFSILDSGTLSATPALQSMPPSLPPLQPLNPAAGSSPLSPPYSASQSPMISPVNNFYPPVMGAPVGMVPTVPAVGLSPQIPQSVMMPAQMSSLPPNSMLYPITFMSNGIIPQPSSLPVMSTTSTVPAHASLQNLQKPQNTWSDSLGTVNINVDNLAPASKYDKQPAPSMNQLVGVNMNAMNMNNLALGMQPMSLNQPIIGSGATVPLVSPVTSNVMIGGVMSPAAVPLQRPMFNSPGNLGV